MIAALRVFLHRLAGMVRGDRAERELDDEMASHLDEATAEYRARGLSPHAARAAAVRDFGGVAQVRELHRETRSFTWPDEIRTDVRYGCRRLLNDPAFTAIVVCTLALGIGANTAIFALLDAIVFKPLPVPAPHELLMFYERGPEGAPDTAGGAGRFLRFSYPRFERLQQALGSDGSMAATTRSTTFAARLEGESRPRFLDVQLVSGGYFSTLGVPAAHGRALTADDGRLDRASPVAVVSDGFWKRALGGTEAAIGRNLVINDVAATIVGVMPPGFFGLWSDAEPDVWMPATLQKALDYRNNTSSYGRLDVNQWWLSQDLIAWVNIVARVPPANVPRAMPRLAAANRQGLEELAARLPAGRRAPMLEHTLVVEPFARGFSMLRGRYADALFALGALVALVLVVTCANVANLLLARGAAQARDMKIRLSLGASTRRLVQQRLVESLLLAVAGGAAGFALGQWTSRLLAREVLDRAGELPAVFNADRRLMAFVALLSIGTAVVCGLVPALRAVRSSRRIALATTQRVAVGHAAAPGMRWLAAGQLALSVVLVFAALLLGRTLNNLMHVDPGFSTDGLVSASFDLATGGYSAAQMPALNERILESVRALPGVTAAATSACGLVAGCSSTSGYRIEGEDVPALRQNWVSGNYFRTTGIRLLSGREFDDHDTARSAPVAIVNESLVRRFFHGQSPLGRPLGSRTADGSAPLDIDIVGVVRDARTQTVHEPAEPMVFFPVPQRGGGVRVGVTNADIRVSGDLAAAAAALRKAIEQAAPNALILDVKPTASRLARDLSRERIVAYLAFTFGLLTLLLASLGLYGVLSYAVTRRTQEIGVRMALGAGRVDVMTAVLGQSARVAVWGVVAGLAATPVLARYLSNMLFGVAPLDPATFVVVLMVFVVVVTTASCLPARRAISVDPLVALRHE